VIDGGDYPVRMICCAAIDRDEKVTAGNGRHPRFGRGVCGRRLAGGRHTHLPSTWLVKQSKKSRLCIGAPSSSRLP
jgi:hypothetical protein